MSVSVVCLYWLPHCSTCQKAEAWLNEHGVEIQSVHDLKAQPITAAALQTLVDGVGGPQNLFSRRAMKYRSMGLDKQTLSDADLIDHMLKEYTFIKRPALLLNNGQALAGFSAKQYQAMFG